MNKLENANNFTARDYYVIVHSLIAYLLLTKGFWKSEVEENNINLDKLRKVIDFFSRTKLHKILKKIQEWVNEYQKQTQKPIFIIGFFEYKTSFEFSEYLCNKILDYNYE